MKIYVKSKEGQIIRPDGVEVLSATDVEIDGESIHEINRRLKNAEEFSKVAWMTPKEKCRKYQIQCCRECEDIGCCDNTNPLNPKYSNPAL